MVAQATMRIGKLILDTSDHSFPLRRFISIKQSAANLNTMGMGIKVGFLSHQWQRFCDRVVWSLEGGAMFGKPNPA